jgi:hypothetical protein
MRSAMGKPRDRDGACTLGSDIMCDRNPIDSRRASE